MGGAVIILTRRMGEPTFGLLLSLVLVGVCKACLVGGR